MGLFTTRTLRKFAALIIDSMSGMLDTWEMDNSITDAQVDNVRRKKGLDGNYYRLLYRKLNVERFGITTYNTPDQNDAAFAHALSLGLDRELLRFGRGEYAFNKTLDLLDLFLDFEGVTDDCTTLSFPGRCVGIHSWRTPQERRGRFRARHLSVRARWQAEDDGVLAEGEQEPNFYGDDNQRMYFYADRKQYHGVFLESVSTLEFVTVTGFSGHQLRTNGNIGSVGTDASLAKVLHCKFSAGGRYNNKGNYGPGYGGCGAYSTGGDGNQIIFEHCDFRDNPQAGNLDGSFLGNQFLACHGSENGWGHYHTINPNAAASYLGCYGEGGSPVSTASLKSVVLGGLHGNGFTGGFNMKGPFVQGAIHFGGTVISDSGNMDFSGDNAFSLMDVATQLAPNAHRALRVPSSDDRVSAMNWVGTGTVIPVRGGPAGDRVASKVSVALDAPIINGGIHRTTATFPAFYEFNEVVRAGDYIVNNDNQGASVPRAWYASVGGFVHDTAYTEGLTATQTNTDAGGIYNFVLKLSAPTQVLQPGQYVTIGGKTSMITAYDMNYGAFAHGGPSEFYGGQAGGATLHMADGSQIPGTAGTTRVYQLNAANNQCYTVPALPPTLAVGTVLRVRYTSDSDVGYMDFQGFLSDTSVLHFTDAMPLGVDMPIAFARAALAPVTQGQGRLADRPTALAMAGRADHAGWTYYATDQPAAAARSTWSGTAWV
jgi:hypothetical protein